MRKIGITALAALYTILILTITVTRTSAWVSQCSETLEHSSGADGSPRIIHPDKADPLPSQKKLVESGFAVELPQEAALGPIPSSRSILLSISEYRSNPGGQQASSRAPPSHS